MSSTPEAGEPGLGGQGRPVQPWDRLNDLARQFSLRSVGLTTLVFLGLVLLWCGGALWVEVQLGDPILSRHLPHAQAGAVDAVWHLATAFVLALPARNRMLWLLAPFLSLGLDIDHLFGPVFPSVVYRSAHTVFFVALAGVALYFLRGRVAALIAPAAILGHLAVDGGSFPLFAPVSVAYVGLSFLVQVLFLSTAAGMFFLAVRSPTELRRRRMWLPLVLAVAALSTLIFFAWPTIVPYTRN